MSGRKTFVGGDILLASELNGFLMDQSVMVFDDAAARDAAIPSPSEGMVVYLKNTNTLFRYTTAWEVVNTGFTASQTITATNASWPVPTLASPVVKVTVIGGGGGGGGAGNTNANGAAGGTTTFDAGGAGSVSAAGGTGGKRSSFSGNETINGAAGSTGNSVGNGGQGGTRVGASQEPSDAGSGNGGLVSVAYLNLTGVATVNLTVGTGGAGGSGDASGGAGGRGEVIVEYVAA